MGGAREFPDDLWGATPPPEVPPSAVVNVRHRGRFRADGSLVGTVAGSRIDLALQLPWPTASAAGMLGNELVTVTWHLQTSESERPATLQGMVGTRTAQSASW